MGCVAITILGPLPESADGNRYLLIAVDYFSKWPEGYPLPNMETAVVANAHSKGFFRYFSMSLEVHSEWPNFESSLYWELCEILGICKTRTTLLHPQSDGMVECCNRTIRVQLFTFVEVKQKDWDNHVPLLLMCYRTMVHDTTNHTTSMLTCLLGKEMYVSLDLVQGWP